MSDDRQRRYLEKFVGLARERLEALNQALLTLESVPGEEEVATEMMRQIHTLKGESRLVKQADITRLAHQTEEVLLRARERAFAAPELVELAFQGFDILGALVERAAGADVNVSFEAFESKASAALELQAEEVADEKQAPSEVAARSAPRDVVAHIRVEVPKLQSLTDAANALIPQHRQLEIALSEADDIVQTWVESMDGVVADVIARAGPGATKDELRAALDAVVERAEGWRTLARRCQRGLTGVSELSFDLSVSLRDARDRVQRIRLLPLARLFAQYPRPIRDLALENGKNVALELDGADVEVDREMMEALQEPLLHLLRNSVDHGIEEPEERRKAGKPERGRIFLSARNRGAEAEIVIEDDGRGVDIERVRQLAVHRGASTPQQAAALSDDEVLSFIFLPGFSTRKETTEVSGRGIGLNVVRERVSALRGSLDVSSQPGQRTRFVLRVPVSMVVTRALVVQAAGTSYAIGSRDVEIVLDHDMDAIEQNGPGWAYRLDERRIPLFDLAALMGSPSRAVETERSRVVVVTHLGECVALRVDLVEGEREVTQRPFDAFLAASEAASGTAVVENGAISVLLSGAQLLALAGRSAAAGTGAATRTEPEHGRGATVLVVDDSELMRSLLVTVLQGHGYRVNEAVNGAEALASLSVESVDLVVADLDMPVMDGFELIERVRASPKTRHTPVVVLSARGSSADRKRASELGADAYVSKTEFEEEGLLRMIATLLPR